MKKLFLAAILIVSTFGLTAFAGDILAIQDGKLITIQAVVDPRLSIIGINNSISLNKLVLASATIHADGASSFIKKYDLSWNVTIDNKDVLFIEGKNEKIGFVAESGKLLVSCKAKIIYAVGEKEIEKEVVAIATAELNPTPNPGPIPTPVVVPDGYLGYTKLIHSEYTKLTLDDFKKKAIAKGLRDSYIAIMAKIAAGAYNVADGQKWIEEVLKDLKDMATIVGENNKINSADILALNKAIGGKIYEDYKAQKLNDIQNWSKLLEAMGEGLKPIIGD